MRGAGYAHPLLLDQLEVIIGSERPQERPQKAIRGERQNCSRRSSRLRSKISRAIPTRDIYRQGGTLGEEYKHWFQAKFLQQFRLFFRYQQTEGAKIIVLAWVNDDSTLRGYESANDAYAVFRKMMKRGKPSLGPLRQLRNSRKARRAGGDAG